MINALIADDHELFRDGLKRIFNETEDIIVVAEAVNGSDAIKKIRAHEECQIIILDINMPDISGLEVLKKYLLKTQNIKCLS